MQPLSMLSRLMSAKSKVEVTEEQLSWETFATMRSLFLQNGMEYDLRKLNINYKDAAK